MEPPKSTTDVPFGVPPQKKKTTIHIYIYQKESHDFLGFSKPKEKNIRKGQSEERGSKGKTAASLNSVQVVLEFLWLGTLGPGSIHSFCGSHAHGISSEPPVVFIKDWVATSDSISPLGLKPHLFVGPGFPQEHMGKLGPHGLSNYYLATRKKSRLLYAKKHEPNRDQEGAEGSLAPCEGRAFGGPRKGEEPRLTRFPFTHSPSHQEGA